MRTRRYQKDSQSEQKPWDGKHMQRRWSDGVLVAVVNAVEAKTQNTQVVVPVALDGLLLVLSVSYSTCETNN